MHDESEVLVHSNRQRQGSDRDVGVVRMPAAGADGVVAAIQQVVHGCEDDLVAVHQQQCLAAFSCSLDLTQHFSGAQLLCIHPKVSHVHLNGEVLL